MNAESRGQNEMVNGLGGLGIEPTNMSNEIYTSISGPLSRTLTRCSDMIIKNLIWRPLFSLLFPVILKINLGNNGYHLF